MQVTTADLVLAGPDRSPQATAAAGLPAADVLAAATTRAAAGAPPPP